MRFASLQSSGNGAKYAQAGKAVVASAEKVFDVQRKTGPDYGKISKVAMKTAAEEKIAGMRAQASVVKAGIASFADVKRTQIGIEADRGVRKAKNSVRKAGAIAAIGKMAAAGFLAASDNDKGRKYPTADYSTINEKFKTDRNALLNSTDTAREALYAESESISNQLLSDPSGTASPTGADSGKVTSGVAPTTPSIDAPTNASKDFSTNTTPSKAVSAVASPSSSPTSKPYSLAGNSKIVADAIAGPESGDWGYEAFNQGGSAKGTKVLGKSGSYKNTYGTSLTDMTLGEIFHKQNTKARGLSFNEHFSSGGLHAVGRYQFIGSTLQDEVKRMGLSPDTKFTPQVQDAIFINHIKRVGNISPWVGPSTKWDQGKKNYINNLIPTL